MFGLISMFSSLKVDIILQRMTDNRNDTFDEK